MTAEQVVRDILTQLGRDGVIAVRGWVRGGFPAWAAGLTAGELAGAANVLAAALRAEADAARAAERERCAKVVEVMATELLDRLARKGYDDDEARTNFRRLAADGLKRARDEMLSALPLIREATT